MLCVVRGPALRLYVLDQRRPSWQQPTVMTVRGPVPAAELGITLAHEHLFFRLDCYYSQAEDDPDGSFATGPITPDRLWWLRSHPFNSRVNLAQEDLATAVWEVEHYKAAGGTTIIDVTTVGISPNPAGLVAVSERTGLHIVAGTGYYLGHVLRRPSGCGSIHRSVGRRDAPRAAGRHVRHERCAPV